MKGKSRNAKRNGVLEVTEKGMRALLERGWWDEL
jgi:hypothetical protein